MARESLQLRVSGGPRAPARCRAAVSALRDTLGDAGKPVELLVSELVSNAVRHGQATGDQAVEVSLMAEPQRVRVEVKDPGAGFTPPRELPSPGRQGNFGLLLVDRIARSWGVEGSTVWVEVDRDGSSPVAA